MSDDLKSKFLPVIRVRSNPIGGDGGSVIISFTKPFAPNPVYRLAVGTSAPSVILNTKFPFNEYRQATWQPKLPSPALAHKSSAFPHRSKSAEPVSLPGQFIQMRRLSLAATNPIYKWPLRGSARTFKTHQTASNLHKKGMFYNVSGVYWVPEFQTACCR